METKIFQVLHFLVFVVGSLESKMEEINGTRAM